MGDDGISVIIPTFNGCRFVGAALASVREQSLQPTEVIVVDAGSSDGTPEVVRMAAQQYPRVRLLCAEHRLSAPQARNVALAQVSTPFVATLDQDDLMIPSRLAQQRAFLAQSPSLAAVGGRLTRVDALGIPSPRRAGASRRAFPVTPESVRWVLRTSMPTYSSSLMFRTAELKGIGGFDEAHTLTDDFALLVALAESGSVANVETVVGRYRVHPGQASGTRRQVMESHLIAWRQLREQLGLTPSIELLECLAKPASCRRPDVLEQAGEVVRAMRDNTLNSGSLTVADRAWIADDAHTLVRRIETARDELGANG